MSTAAEAARLPAGPILVATDFSADADRAVARAALVAAASERTLILLAVAPREALLPPWLGDGMPALASEERLLKTIEGRLAETAARHRLPAFRLAVRFGKPWEAILEEARGARASLIVLGARGERGATSGLGSTAWRVLQGARAPLLLVRRAAPSPYRRILVALDFDAAAAAVFAAALEVAASAEVLLMHALGGAPRLSLLTHGGASLDPLDVEPTALLAEARSRLEDFVRDRAAGRALEIRVVAGDPVAAVAKLVEEGCEAVAFGAPHRHPWLGRLLGSFALAQLSSASADLLIAPATHAHEG
jgi:nucleotide-binding universal stress UspA family protein